MKTKLKFSLMTLVMAVMIMFSSLDVFALTAAELQTYVNEHGISKISEANRKLSNDSTDQIAVTYDNITYYITPAGVTEAEAHLASINQQKEEMEDVTSQISGVGELGVQPNVGEAMTSLSGFIPALNLVIGILVVILTAGMTLFTATDLCYVIFPMFRGKCDDAKQNDSKTFSLFDRIVSDEARHSVRAAETVETGKNPLGIYFGKRVVSHLILAVILVVLLTGNITIITNIAVKAVVGIIEIIQKAGA